MKTRNFVAKHCSTYCKPKVEQSKKLYKRNNKVKNFE
jgi:hypothetical protein